MGMESTPELKMVEVRVSRMFLRENTRGQQVQLKERDGPRWFTLVIGAWEAEEIRRVVSHEQAPRPMTHQLALALVHALGGRVLRADIVDFRDQTFIGQLAVESLDGKTLALVDARPSDAIALALRSGAPIRVAEFVLEQVRADSSGPDPMPDAPSEPPPGPPPESPEDPTDAPPDRAV